MLGQSILPRSLYSGSVERERWSSRYKPFPCCCGISSHRIQYHFPWGSDQPLQILYVPPITALEPLAGCPSVSTCTQLCLLPALCSVTWHELQQHSLSPSRPAEPAHLQFRWSQYLVMTGNWWQTWDVELGPEGSRVTPLSLPCPD